jgi:hypothetical protein
MAAPDTSLTAAIVEREPALALPGSPIAKAESALRWASGVMTWNNEVPTHLPEFATLTARQMVEEVFLPRAYGVMCGGMAIFLCRILEQFAIRSLVVQCGYEAGVNHVTVLVPDRGKFFLFDPMFSGTYRPVGEWRHLDLAAVLRGESFVFRTNRAAPIILKRPEEVSERACVGATATSKRAGKPNPTLSDGSPHTLPPTIFSIGWLRSRRKSRRWAWRRKTISCQG